MQPKKKFRIASLAGMVCLCAIFLAACGGNTTTTGNNSVPASPDKQILRVSHEGGDFDSLDPALTQSAEDPVNILFTGLVATRDDGTIVDQLAASHQVSADGLTYTFTL
ncbi:MAG: peptide ABC transporter substrate-binding protein, partial [Chloroflexi bacterium]|nr:peptide ABC transporter substrate-binding protein [Chloroflexota bacterium]